MREYERFSASIRRTGMFRYSDDPRVQRAEVLPTLSDFICDVELTCKRALTGNPRLLALFRGIYVEEGFSEKKVQDKLPQEFQQLAEICGAALRRTIPNV